MSETELATKISLEGIKPQEALAAVISGYSHHVGNPLSILSPTFEIGSADQMVMTPGQDMNQRVDISGRKTQEAVRTTAQAIIDRVRGKVCSRPYSHPRSAEPEKDWFAFAEKLVAEWEDPEEKTRFVKALARIKVCWTNLVNLANPDKLITLPLEPGDSEANPFQFVFSHPVAG